MINILLFDDNEESLNFTASVLKDNGCSVHTISSPDYIYIKAHELDPNLIILKSLDTNVQSICMELIRSMDIVNTHIILYALHKTVDDNYEECESYKLITISTDKDDRDLEFVLNVLNQKTSNIDSRT